MAGTATLYIGDIGDPKPREENEETSPKLGEPIELTYIRSGNTSLCSDSI